MGDLAAARARWEAAETKVAKDRDSLDRLSDKLAQSSQAARLAAAELRAAERRADRDVSRETS